MRGFLSIDIDVSELQVNQCNLPQSLEYRHARNNKLNHYDEIFNQIEAFHDSHKCHLDSMMVCMIEWFFSSSVLIFIFCKNGIY